MCECKKMTNIRYACSDQNDSWDSFWAPALLLHAMSFMMLNHDDVHAYSDDVYCDVYDDDVYNMLYDG